MSVDNIDNYKLSYVLMFLINNSSICKTSNMINKYIPLMFEIMQIKLSDNESLVRV